METVKTFLESSTIHGLAHISTTSKCVRILWTFIVFTGFIGASVIIFQSFQVWNESPVKTTIETLPIHEVTFPKVTVCPPKDTYTNLNYDFIMANHMTINNQTRDELVNFIFLNYHDKKYEEIMKNMSVVQFIEKSRYYYWYYGLTKMILPQEEENFKTGAISDTIETYATSGYLETCHYGENFDKNNLVNVASEINIYVPYSAVKNESISLHFEYEEIDYQGTNNSAISNFSPPELKSTTNYQNSYEYYYIFSFGYLSSWEYHHTLDNMTLMPGFKLKWYYNVDIEEQFQYSYDKVTMEFVRNILHLK